MHLRKRFVLASASPRRQQLLRQIGLTFDVIESNIDETVDPSDNPAGNVLRISREKTAGVKNAVDDGIILGADTVVVLDDEVLGKPQDGGEAAAMLRKLSGREHAVYTGFTLLDRPSDATVSACEMTRVWFRTLGAGEISEYVASGSPLDKAGAYGIQDDYGAVFVERIEGCFYNVVGLPLARLYSALERFQEQVC